MKIILSMLIAVVSITAFSQTREIRLQGASNFRDLGGYKTKDGQQTRWGKVYRSADISKLTDEDLKTLLTLHIRMVCDLRSETEATNAPDRLPEGTERVLLSAGSENLNNQDFMKSLKTEQSADSMMRVFYRRTDHLGKKYKPMFDQLLSLPNDQALLFHCTAGKDRTGIGAALFLYALGVDDATIYADYDATNLYRKDITEQSVAMMVKQGFPEMAARNMMAAKPEYLQATFNAINKQYGSVDQFLETEIGLTKSNRKKLSKMYVE